MPTGKNTNVASPPQIACATRTLRLELDVELDVVDPEPVEPLVELDQVAASERDSKPDESCCWMGTAGLGERGLWLE